APAAALDRPVPLPAGDAVVDPRVQPTVFSRPPADGPLVIRGASPGSTEPDPGVVLHGWRRSPEVLDAPRGAGPAFPVAASPPLAPPAPPGAHGPVVPPPVPADGGHGFWPGMAPAPGECPGEACDGCGCGDGCHFGYHWYARAEYLLWWVKGDPVPP